MKLALVAFATFMAIGVSVLYKPEYRKDYATTTDFLIDREGSSFGTMVGTARDPDFQRRQDHSRTVLSRIIIDLAAAAPAELCTAKRQSELRSRIGEYLSNKITAVLATGRVAGEAAARSAERRWENELALGAEATIQRLVSGEYLNVEQFREFDRVEARRISKRNTAAPRICRTIEAV